MNKKPHFATLAFLFCVLAYIIAPLNSKAAENNFLREGTLSISPFLNEIEIITGKTANGQITITNQGEQSKNISYSIQDFIPSGGEGQVRFLETESTTPNPYSLANWIEITKQPELKLPPKSSTTIEFQISPPENATHGSHFAGILFAEEAGGVNGQVKVAKKLGSLIILRYGKGVISGNISQNQKSLISNIPFSIETTFHNTGNTHLSPKGDVNIYNWMGRLVSSNQINKDANIVMPETERTFSTKINKFLFGRYKISSIVYYGSDPKLEARNEYSVWIFPITKIGEKLAIAMGATVLLYLCLSGYNKWLLKKYA